MALDLTNFFAAQRALGTLNEQRVANAMRQQEALEERAYREAAARQAHKNALAVMERQAEINRQAQIDAENRALFNRAVAAGLDYQPGDVVDPALLSQMEREIKFEDQARQNQMALDLERAQQRVIAEEAGRVARAGLQAAPLDALPVAPDPSLFVDNDAEYSPEAYREDILSDPYRAQAEYARMLEDEKATRELETKRRELDLAEASKKRMDEQAQIAKANEASMQYLIDLGQPVPEGGMPVDLQGALELQQQMGSLSKFQNPELRATAAVYHAAQESFGRAIAKAEADGDTTTANELKEEEAKLTKAIAESGASGYISVLKKERELARLEASRTLAQTRGDQRLLAMLDTRIADARKDLKDDPYYIGVAPKPEDTDTGTGTGIGTDSKGSLEGAQGADRALGSLKTFLEGDFVASGKNRFTDFGRPGIRELGDRLNTLESYSTVLARTTQPEEALGLVNSALATLEGRKALALEYADALSSEESLRRRRALAKDPVYEAVREDVLTTESSGRGLLGIAPEVVRGAGREGEYGTSVDPSITARIDALKVVRDNLLRRLGVLPAITPLPSPAPTPTPAPAPTPAPLAPLPTPQQEAEKRTGVPFLRRAFGR